MKISPNFPLAPKKKGSVRDLGAASLKNFIGFVIKFVQYIRGVIIFRPLYIYVSLDGHSR